MCPNYKPAFEKHLRRKTRNSFNYEHLKRADEKQLPRVALETSLSRQHPCCQLVRTGADCDRSWTQTQLLGPCKVVSQSSIPASLFDPLASALVPILSSRYRAINTAPRETRAQLTFCTKPTRTSSVALASPPLCVRIIRA